MAAHRHRCLPQQTIKIAISKKLVWSKLPSDQWTASSMYC